MRCVVNTNEILQLIIIFIIVNLFDRGRNFVNKIILSFY